MHCNCILFLTVWPSAQPRPKSWGEPRFGSQHRGACAPRQAKGRAGCWVREGVAPSAVRIRGYDSGKLLKTQMLNRAFWWLLAVKFLAFWNLQLKSWGEGTNTLLLPIPKVGGPVSPGPYGCCAYVLDAVCYGVFSSECEHERSSGNHCDADWSISTGETVTKQQSQSVSVICRCWCCHCRCSRFVSFDGLYGHFQTWQAHRLFLFSVYF